ncbi:MAG: glycosyltransferase family 4 protein [Desulfobacterota bacterium]|nr:glycosyltransferase family 4 protein [Thermodesulfobacteriota bacterium]
MKAISILHVFDCYLPETENWAYRMLKSIPDTEIRVAAIRFNGKFQDKDFSFYRFPLNPFRYATTFFGTVLIPGLIKPLYPYYLRNRMQSPDIIHAHFANTSYFFLKLKKLFNRPFVISFYGFDYGALPAATERWKERYQKLFNEADLFLCEGAAGVQLLEAQGCPAEKIGIARIGVEIERIPFFKRIKHPCRLNLLQVATFRKKKGHRDTIAAFAAALKECPHMHLTLVGEDSGDGTREEVLTKITRMGIGDHITIIDKIDYTHLHLFMKDFDVFIQPSCFTEECDCEGGAPVALLDAQATGLPVIATQHCDIPEVVLHGHTGLLAPEHDIVMLTEHIKAFYYMDGAAYDRYSEQARAHVQHSYNARICGVRLRRWYEKLLNKGCYVP